MKFSLVNLQMALTDDDYAISYRNCDKYKRQNAYNSLIHLSGRQISDNYTKERL